MNFSNYRAVKAYVEHRYSQVRNNQVSNRRFDDRPQEQDHVNRSRRKQSSVRSRAA